MGPLAAVAIIDIEPNPPGNDEEHLDAERVTIQNNGTMPVELSGWTLRDESTANRFRLAMAFCSTPARRSTL